MPENITILVDYMAARCPKCDRMVEHETVGEIVWCPCGIGFSPAINQYVVKDE